MHFYFKSKQPFDAVTENLILIFNFVTTVINVKNKNTRKFFL